MNRIKYSLLTIAAVLCLQISAFALPGVNSFIPDLPGQFVYYKDSSFNRESYIGVVYYDDSTYGFRYIAPQVADKKNPKPKLEMQVFVTIDPNKTKLEFTGERVEPFPRSQEETDIINYIHDFAYEMTAKRQSIDELKEIIVDRQDWAQFGGEVDLEYDPLVPIFNLRKIVALDKKIILDVVTAGRLLSSDDTTFVDFQGFPKKIVDKNHSFKSIKVKPEPVVLKNEGYADQSFDLDVQWTQKSPAIWALGNSAIITNTSLSFPNNFSAYESLYLLRSLLLGADHSYPDWTTQKLDFENSEISIKQTFYDSESSSFKYDFKKVKSIGKGAKSIFGMTVFAGSYTPNKKYFDSIFNSYKTTN